MDEHAGAVHQDAYVEGSHNVLIQATGDVVVTPARHELIHSVLARDPDREESPRSRRPVVGAFILGLAILLAVYLAIENDGGAPSPDMGPTAYETPSNPPAAPTAGGHPVRPHAPSSHKKTVQRNDAPPRGRGAKSGNGPRNTLAAASPEQSGTVPPYHGWLWRDGALIRYDARVHMPGSCPGRIMAVGDFGPGGWTSGPEARCEADGWLTFDAGQLLEQPRFVPGHTYCLNFVDGRGRYGRHGAPPRAPGLSTIGVPAREGEQAGINIGFHVVRSVDGPRVEFTKEGTPHCE